MLTKQTKPCSLVLACRVARFFFVFLLSILFSQNIFSESTTYCFRVYLKKATNTDYSIEKPLEFLSQEAIDRRLKLGIEITSADFPILKAYKDSILQSGGHIVAESKWQETVVVEHADSLLSERLENISVVDSVRFVWKGKQRTRVYPRDDESLIYTEEPLKKEYYGYAKEQIKMLNGISLHKKGYKGKGVRIAVIDAGFKNVDRLNVFKTIHLLGTKNFISNDADVFSEDDHGTKVLSCMAANLPGIMVGTAPEASYLLLKTEDERSEYPIEEDYWTAAVEYADSVGVDIITSSLGYFKFNTAEQPYTTNDLDGKTAYITRTANMAVDKGLLLFCSAGNEGESNWGKIVFPSDATNTITVGAIDIKKQVSSFSSRGFLRETLVKPNFVALGTATCVIDSDGDIRYSNGTSFSTPTLAGLGACLYQALPCVTPQKFIDLMMRSAHNHKNPDADIGYGIPNVYKIYKQEHKNAFREK